MTTIAPVQDVAAAARSAADGAFDAVVIVSPDPTTTAIAAAAEVARQAARVDARIGKDVVLLPASDVAGARLILAPTGPLGRDQDDVRRYADAARAGVTRARDAGAVRPLLVVEGVPDEPAFAHARAVAALGALGGLWQPLEAREAHGEGEVEPIRTLGFGGDAQLAAWVEAVESGQRLARDLGGTDPERMAPPRFAELCEQAFAGTGVTVEVVANDDEITRDYPLAAAVARASLPVARHRPRIVRLEYTGSGPIERTVLLAGKAVTYDTGGADIKAGGVMAGMSRDKGGGAAVAGLLRAVAALAPANVRVIAEIGAVRNSIGADSYVADEILTSHAGVRVRVGNTDAEGRLVLADLLSHLRERALRESDPCLLSVATLTGHAARAVGPYSIALDNGPALQRGIAARLAAVGDAWGDPFDVSRLRREDWDFVRPRSRADDVLQCNNAPSTATARGHQFPMAFLAIASGLDAHGRDGERPLPFTHVDIAGSAVEGSDWQHGRPTGAPVVALLQALVIE